MSECLFRNYGLKCGEPVKLKEHSILDKRKKTTLFQERPPDRVMVVAEFPYLIQLRGTWESLHSYQYDFCVEKASIYSGEVELIRERTGQRLMPLELQNDYEQERRKR